MTKVLSKAALLSKLKPIRRGGKKIVFTNGCFDILHKGHVQYLDRARKFGDVLVIGLNADASVRRLKGPERPLNNQADRATVLSALACVDFVTIFHEDTPLNLIRSVEPDVLVKGGDWKKKDVVGSIDVAKRGGSVRIVPYVKGFSTTGLLDKIRSL